MFFLSNCLTNTKLFDKICSAHLFLKNTTKNFVVRGEITYRGLKNDTNMKLSNGIFESLLCSKTMRKEIKITHFNLIPKFSINEKPHLFQIMIFLQNEIVFSSQWTNWKGLFRNNFRNVTFQAKEISWSEINSIIFGFYPLAHSLII